MTELVWLLLLVPVLATLGTHRLLRSVYRRYRAVHNHVTHTACSASASSRRRGS
jgi:hypothetical protein